MRKHSIAFRSSMEKNGELKPGENSKQGESQSDKGQAG